MRGEESGKARPMFTVLYHSLLIGAALFVPIPLLDDRMATFLWRHMVADLAKVHKRNLTREQILALSYSSRFSLSEGCLALLGQLLKAKNSSTQMCAKTASPVTGACSSITNRPDV